MNRTEIVGSTNVETTSLKAPWSLSLGAGVYVSGSGLGGQPVSPARVSAIRAPAAENFDIETGVSEDVVGQSSPTNMMSSMNVSTSPLPLPQGGIVKVTKEPAYSRTNRRPADFTRGITETSTQPARIFRTRVKRHSVILWGIQKPGLADLCRPTT